MVFCLNLLLLSYVVEHVFVINVMYGMLAFDAQTAEKIALKTEPQKRPVWKGPTSLVTDMVMLSQRHGVGLRTE